MKDNFFKRILSVIIPTILILTTMQSCKTQEEEIKKFINFCEYKVSDFDKIEEKFHKLFPKGTNLGGEIGKILDDNLKKGGMHPSLTPYLAEQDPPLRLVWFGKECKKYTGWNMSFFVDSNDNIVRSQLYFILNGDNFLSHNIPFKFKYFSSIVTHEKNIEKALMEVLKYQKIDDIDQFMESAGAEKIKISDKNNSSNQSKYRYRKQGLFFDAIINDIFYQINLDVDNNNISNIDVKESFTKKLPTTKFNNKK